MKHGINLATLEQRLDKLRQLRATALALKDAVHREPIGENVDQLCECLRNELADYKRVQL